VFERQFLPFFWGSSNDLQKPINRIINQIMIKLVKTDIKHFNNQKSQKKKSNKQNIKLKKKHIQ